MDVFKVLLSHTYTVRIRAFQEFIYLVFVILTIILTKSMLETGERFFWTNF